MTLKYLTLKSVVFQNTDKDVIFLKSTPVNILLHVSILTLSTLKVLTSAASKIPLCIQKYVVNFYFFICYIIKGYRQNNKFFSKQSPMQYLHPSSVPRLPIVINKNYCLGMNFNFNVTDKLLVN